MEYVCHCGNNYLLLDPLSSGEVIKNLQTAIETELCEENINATESLALIKTILDSVSLIAKYVPDFGENYVSTLTMEIPLDAEEIPCCMDNPILLQTIQENVQPDPKDNSCRKCESIDHQISVILSFGFLMLGIRRFRETELLKKIIYLLCPFRRKHSEIREFYQQVWDLICDEKICSSLLDHIVIFMCHPIEENLKEVLKSEKINITTILNCEKYRYLREMSIKSRKVFNLIIRECVKLFLSTRKSYVRDFLTYFVENVKNSMLCSYFLKHWNNTLYPFVALAVDNFLEMDNLNFFIDHLKFNDYKNFVALGISFKQFHYLTDELVVE
ncbi:hypothetical protein DMENIID0001_007490 [Sergentomyia squamirostris]